MEATGRLHHAWVIELERRWPGSVRLFAPSETQAARTQLGSRRYNSDDRDCAALVWLVRQGAGRPAATDTVDALLGAVGHRRGLVADRKVLQPPRPAPGAVPRAVSTGRPRPCPGRSDRPGGPGLCGRLRRPARRCGRCRPERPVSLTKTTAGFWVDRWRRLLPPPDDAELRAERLGRGSGPPPGPTG